MMKRWMIVSLTGVCMATLLTATQVARAVRPTEPRVRFAPVHIYLDSGDKPLAAYQFELKATTGRIKIVGVEGGEHAAFKEAPYYDPAALAKDRIIIAAFNTGRDLPQYELDLTVAADADGRKLPAKLSLERGEVK